MPSRNRSVPSITAVIAAVLFPLLLLSPRRSRPTVAFQSRAHYYLPHQAPRIERHHFHIGQKCNHAIARGVGVAFTPLYATGDSEGGSTKSSSSSSSSSSSRNTAKAAKGVYVRPSGAIERGSGFFFPGLEGPRVRVLFGTVLLGLTAVNHVAVSEESSIGALSLEEIVTIGYSLLVLFQAAIEFGKEELVVEGNSISGGAASGKGGASSLLQRDLVQQWNNNAAILNQKSQKSKDMIQWAAASYLSVTPATQMLLLTKKDAILYRLGSDDGSSSSSAAVKDGSTIAEGVEAALDQLSQSKGGRLALPKTHPAAIALGLQEARTVVLQRITDDSCWVMSSSDQLLASFTSSDLKWLGQLARYVRRYF